ncbi:TatD family hydrolase [Deinococcus lacus]|uniref:TatD family hydrolase n=1 Tax=Deinococcus lacus TaxID=392561 RepID=A0ABW1YCL1_9DEIO
MIDTHCHLDYLHDPASARSELGLTGMVCIGAGLEHARSAVTLAEQFPDVWATVGIHPTSTEEDTPENRAELERLAQHPRVVGIGESGLDDYWDAGQRAPQLRALEWQLDLAGQLGKPLVIHVRDKKGEDSAHRGLLEVLPHWPDVTLIFHCFSGNRDLLAYGLEHGHYFGFAGNVTYKNAPEIQAAAREVPLDRLLLETDAPFLAPVPKRGKPNRPGFVRHTLEFVAALRQMPPEQLEAATDQNASRVYSFSL